MKVVSFTGHRPQKLGGFAPVNPIKSYVISELDKLLDEIKPDKCISGMALGLDQWAADMCVLKNIPFIAAIPFIGQESVWPEHSKGVYKYLLDKAEETVIVSEGGYAPWKMQERNEWMTDRADIIIACWDGSPSGTKNCVDYANKKNKDIRIINPNKHTPIV